MGRRVVERDRLLALDVKVHAQVLLHILSDGWEVVHERHTDFLQVLGVSHPREHEKLRRADGAARQNDLFRRSNSSRYLVSRFLKGSTSTPTARFPSNTSLLTNVSVRTVKFSLDSTESVRYAADALDLEPL